MSVFRIIDIFEIAISQVANRMLDKSNSTYPHKFTERKASLCLCVITQSCSWNDVCRLERRPSSVTELPRADHRRNIKQSNSDVARGSGSQRAGNHHISGKSL